jgi:glycerol uptake facilitator-like aquaporin
MNLLKSWYNDPKPNILSKVAAEFIACAMFHFIGSVSPTAYTNGLALMVLVYYTAKTSGAHLNPALSLSFMLLGYNNPLEILFYWIAQILGCAFGSLWIALLVPGVYIGQQMSGDLTKIGEAYNGCFNPSPQLTKAGIFGWEAICTFNFILPIFSVVWYTINKPGYGTTGPLMVGLSLTVNALVAGPFTGGALNPARVLGSMIVFNCPNAWTSFYYITGELVAGIIVPLFIIPWYGVCPTAWYFNLTPENNIKTFLKTHQRYDLHLPSIKSPNASSDKISNFDSNTNEVVSPTRKSLINFNSLHAFKKSIYEKSQSIPTSISLTPRQIEGILSPTLPYEMQILQVTKKLDKLKSLDIV